MNLNKLLIRPDDVSTSVRPELVEGLASNHISTSSMRTDFKYHRAGAKVVGKNNFDLLRFLFAVTVLLVHSYVLSDAHALSILSKLLSSELAVKCFFIVSGFLIFMSYENTDHNGQFFLKRARRIYPAYFSVVLLCVLFGSVFATCSFSEYWSFPTLKYIIANLIFLNFLQPNLPGLFEGNTLQAVNGALWTLKIEVMFYLFVPLAVMAFRRFGRLRVLFFLYISSVVYSLIVFEIARRTGVGAFLELQRQLPGQLTYFIAGATGYYYLEYLIKRAVWLVALALVAFALQAWLPWLAVEPLAIGILVVYFACIFHIWVTLVSMAIFLMGYTSFTFQYYRFLFRMVCLKALHGWL